MKKISLMGLALLSLMAAGLSGCSSEDSLSRDNNNAAGVTIKASIDNPASRVAFKDEDSKLKTYWKDAADVEKFSLHYTGSSATNYLFVKGATTDAKSASFTCSSTPTVETNATVYAVYPGVSTNSANATTIGFSLKDQPGTEATTTSTGDVGDFNFMVASATVPEGGLSSASFGFVHKVALVKMVLTFPDDVTGNITNISINSAAMHNAGTYTLSTGAWSYTDAQKGSVSTKSDATFALTDHKVTVWLAVFPEALTGVTITATAGSNIYRASMSDVTFDASKVYSVSKTLAKVNFKSNYTVADYYMWDAYSSYQNISSGTWGASSAWYHTGDATTKPTQSCKNCPSKDDLIKYLNAGPVYWDNGTIGNAATGLQTYTLPNNTKYHTGIWLLKKSQWPETISGTSSVTPTAITAENVGIRTNGKYFFLPAAGYYYYDASFSYAGDTGFYWSSTPNDSDFTYRLYFDANWAKVTTEYRDMGYLPMVAE